MLDKWNILDEVVKGKRWFITVDVRDAIVMLLEERWKNRTTVSDLESRLEQKCKNCVKLQNEVVELSVLIAELEAKMDYLIEELDCSHRIIESLRSADCHAHMNKIAEIIDDFRLNWSSYVNRNGTEECGS